MCQDRFREDTGLEAQSRIVKEIGVWTNHMYHGFLYTRKQPNNWRGGDRNASV